MPLTTDLGFTKADPRNLPKVTVEMLFTFFNSVQSLKDPAIQNMKTMRSTRSTYGYSAVGFVQLKRDTNKFCYVKACVTPEHAVGKAAYTVTCVIDEGEQSRIIEAKCEGCAASAGCCKHAICLASWIHRRTEDPAVTSGECLWKKPTLSLVGNAVKFQMVSEKAKPPPASVSPEKLDSFFNLCIPMMKTDTSVIGSMLDDMRSIDMHHLMIDYKYGTPKPHSYEIFRQFAESQMDQETRNKIAFMTSGQSSTKKWYAYRYGRCTASKVHDASRCQTEDGSLVNGVFGGHQIRVTDAMQRGLDLEVAVLNEPSKIVHRPYKQIGLVLRPKYPFYGASPDAVMGDSLVEIKCPTSEERLKYYLNKDRDGPSTRFLEQVMFQLFMCQREHCFFVVADPKFEQNKRIKVMDVFYDKELLRECYYRSKRFCRDVIYPKLYASV